MTDKAKYLPTIGKERLLMGTRRLYFQVFLITILSLISSVSLQIPIRVPTVHAATAVVAYSSPNAQANGFFGASVAMGQGIVVVGAPNENSASGNVYVFDTSGSLTAVLSSPNRQSGGRFGLAVSTSGTNIVIGADGELVGTMNGAGHAYIFTITGVLIATLTSPNAQGVGSFGGSVAISGNSVVVGAEGETANGLVTAGH